MADRQDFQQERQVWSKPLNNPLTENVLFLPEEVRQVLAGLQVVGSLVVRAEPQLRVGLILPDLGRIHLARVQEVLTDLTLQADLGVRHSQDRNIVLTTYFAPVIRLDSQLELNYFSSHFERKYSGNCSWR